MHFPNTDDPLVAALQRLIERVGSTQAVAEASGINDQSLYQIAFLKAHSSTGKPKSVGPSIRKRLSNAFPDWMQPTAVEAKEPQPMSPGSVVQLRRMDPAAVMLELREILQRIPEPERHGMAGLWASFCNSAGAEHHMTALMALLSVWTKSKDESTDSQSAGA